MANNSVEYILSLKDKFSSGIKSATSETEKLNGSMGMAQKSALGLGSAIAAIGGGLIAREIVNTTAAMEGLQNQLNFASGSAEQGARDFQYLRKTSEEMGLDLLSATNGFVGLAASFKGTSIEGQAVRDVFEGMAMASTVNHMSAQQTAQAFKALSDMAGKGVVSMEELRGQLGDAGLRGAFKIAADAMQMTTKDLNKFVSDGKLMAEDFIPKFAAQLKKEFVGGMDAAGESLTSQLNRMNNAFLEIKLTLGELLMPVILTVVDTISSFTNFVREHADAIAGLTGAFVGLYGAIFIYNAYMKIAAIWSGAKFIYGIWSLAAALDGVTVAQWLLNTATAFFAGLSGVGLFLVAAGAAAALAVGIYAANAAQEKLNKTTADGAKTKFEGWPGMGDTSKEFNFATAGFPKKGNQAAAMGGAPDSTNKAKGGTGTNVVESRGVQNFNISIKEFGSVTLNTTNIKEGANQIKEVIAQALIEAVNDFQLMATK
jgi:tape measure domain-containing protein